MLDSLIKILIFQAMGEILVVALALPIPGPVVGMLLLFLFLVARGSADERLVGFSAGFLRHLTLLFIPAAVGIILQLERVAQEWLPILAALAASTFLSILVTALVVRRLSRAQ